MRAFSAKTRAELARVQPGGQCCSRAELGGILRGSGSLHLLGLRRVSLSVQTEYADVARKVVMLLRAVAGLPAEVVVEDHGSPRHKRVYHVQLLPDPAVRQVLTELGILNAEGDLYGGVPGDLVRKGCCRAAFLRGAYLMRGSVCDPRGASYHLEVVADNEDFALGLCYLLNLARFKAHLGERKGKQVVYLKDADDIAGFLSLIGAHAALLELEEVRVVKDVRGGVNRLVNAETANVSKSVVAAMEQIRLINDLRKAGILRDLPMSLRQLAQARVAHPEATLAELGQGLRPPLSKSAVNHRFRKLRKYAEDLQEGV